jgi:hypothetical protein
MAAMVIALHHLRDLLEASWTASVASMGTTTLAIGALVVSVFIPFVYTILKDGFGSVRPHLTRLLGESAFVLFLWASLYTWNVVKIIYQDHNHFVQQIQQMKIAAANAAKPRPPKQVGLGWSCEMSGVPTENPPHTTTWLLPLTINGTSGVEGLISGFSENTNGGDKPMPLFPHDWLKELKSPTLRFESVENGMSARRCEIRNLGQESFSNVEIIFDYDFTRPNENTAVCSRLYGVIVPQIDPGKPFIFYAINVTATSAHFAFPKVATLELPDSARQTVEMRMIGTQMEGIFPLFPTQIWWNGRAPELNEKCTEPRKS